MKRIDASEFEKRCRSLLDGLGPDGIVITKRGKPIARLVPVESGCADLIGSMKGKIGVKGDVFSAGLKWDDGRRLRRGPWTR